MSHSGLNSYVLALQTHGAPCRGFNGVSHWSKLSSGNLQSKVVMMLPAVYTCDDWTRCSDSAANILNLLFVFSTTDHALCNFDIIKR